MQFFLIIEKGTVMIAEDKLNELKTLLSKQGKHTGYQMLPPCLLEMDSDLINFVGTKRQDEQRYDWFKSKWDQSGVTAIDIGANLGYFSFKLAQDFSTNTIAYEPYSPHAQVISVIRDLCKFSAEQIKIENKGVGLRDIDSLPDSSLVFLLNVIQHAGEDFDADLVTSVEQWRDYAIEYLKKLRQKTDFLFFQTGYKWLGHEDKLCNDHDIIDFTAKLFTDSGWSIKNCAVIKKLNSSFSYEDYDLSLTEHNPVFLLKLKTNTMARIKWKILKLRGITDRVSYSFAQRPLFICENKK